MANSGGHSGAVTIVSTSSGDTVSVAYPADGTSQPPQTAHTDTHNNPPEWAMKAFRSGLPPAGPVGVTVDGSGNPSSVKVPG